MFSIVAAFSNAASQWQHLEMKDFGSFMAFISVENGLSIKIPTKKNLTTRDIRGPRATKFT